MEIILKMDGLDYKFPETQAGVVQAISKKLEEAKVIKADHDALVAKLDSAKSEIEKRDAQIVELTKITKDEKEMAKRVQERMDVLEFSKKVFPTETKLDEISTSELRKKIVKKCMPDLDIEKKDDQFIEGICQGITFGFKTDATKELEEGFKHLAEKGAKEPFVKDEAEKKYAADLKDMWKKGSKQEAATK